MCDMELEQCGCRMFELPGLVSALQSGVRCADCAGTIQKDIRLRSFTLGLNFFWSACFEITTIPFAKVPSSKVSKAVFESCHTLNVVCIT